MGRVKVVGFQHGDCAILNCVLGRLCIAGHEGNSQCWMALSCNGSKCDAAHARQADVAEASGAKIAIVITSDIRAVLDSARSLGKVKSLCVFHTLKGRPFSASAIKSAWRRARERAGVADAWFRDLRPKALSDAKRQGLSLEKVRDAAGHTSVSTTEGYIRGFEVKEANLNLTLPKPKRSA